VPIPGVSALTTLLSVSGFLMSEQQVISFVGFLPPTQKAKKELLAECLTQDRITIFFESPIRVVSTLELISELSPNSIVVLGRELTKVHEEVLRFEARNYPKNVTPKGEFTLAINPDKKLIKNNKVTTFRDTAGEPRKIASMLANYLNLDQKKAYTLLAKLKNELKPNDSE
ncbi:MAG: SAM-dependent methyltransferase, partial [Pseudomonadota bacterium]